MSTRHLINCILLTPNTATRSRVIKIYPYHKSIFVAKLSRLLISADDPNKSHAFSYFVW